jgi:hypothetical protein
MNSPVRERRAGFLMLKKTTLQLATAGWHWLQTGDQAFFEK